MLLSLSSHKNVARKKQLLFTVVIFLPLTTGQTPGKSLHRSQRLLQCRFIITALFYSDMVWPGGGTTTLKTNIGRKSPEYHCLHFKYTTDIIYSKLPPVMSCNVFCVVDVPCLSMSKNVYNVFYSSTGAKFCYAS